MKEIPALSVILSTSGRFANIRSTFRHLQRQTVADQLEIILLAPSTENFGLTPEDTAVFRAVQLIGLGQITTVGYANAEGVRRATAPLIVFSEDHAFPEKGWAEALIARHAEDWAVVGPMVKNGNPRTAVSWADYMLGYGPWHPHRTPGPVQMLPGHNSSYKRDFLLSQGERLPEILQAESVFHQALVEKGERLYLENRAIISHLNFAQLPILLAIQRNHGRLYAACRSGQWPLWKRLFYTLASPLIPLVRLMRILRSGIRFPQRPPRWRIIAALFADLTADGLGQGAGYLCGPGKSAEFLTDYEYDRLRFTAPGDSVAAEAR